ncbi:MAG: threonine/serine exporter family protein [bacterium]|nr:threonine/serine exporter family protein [bacterium]
MVIRVIGAFLAVVCFSILLEMPLRQVLYAGFVGGIGWMMYLLVGVRGSDVAAAFVSSLVIALLCHILARIFKMPVTVYFVAGILPSVPGASIYRAVLYLIQGKTGLSNYYMVQTLQIAGAIAMAIFIMDSLFRVGKKERCPLRRQTEE